MMSLISTTLISFMLLTGGNPKPPGTILFNDNLFIDQTEVSNIAWIEYIHWLKQAYGEESTEVVAAYPDSASWETLYGAPFSVSIFDNVYLDYPVVGVSYEQASSYCDWRTKVVAQNLPDLHIIYRLPSESELKTALSTEKDDVSKYKNRDLNIHRAPGKVKGQHVLFLSNNVSEMTDKPGVAFGGNFQDRENMSRSYETPQAWLGFRCIAEVGE